MLARRTLLLAALGLPGISSAQDTGPAIGTYTMTGKVKHTGKFDLRDGMRIVDAIVRAGGFLDFAKTQKIVIIRSDKRFTFNYRAFIRGEQAEANLVLRDGDEVVVP